MGLLVGVATAVMTGAAAATLWLRRRYVLVTIQGSSMKPTFHTGDRVLVRRTPLAAIRNGAVVVVEQPVIGLPDATLSWDRSVGGKGLDRLWMIKRAAAVPGTTVPDELAAALGTTPGDPVPPGHLAVLGDNANGSYDSRICGYLTETQVLGVAVRSVSRASEQPPPVDLPFPDDPASGDQFERGNRV